MKARASISALVPVRGLAAGKRRLAGAIGEADRRALVQAMLVDVLDALKDAASVGLIIVVSSDRAVGPIAEQAGALLLPDAPEGGLNASLQAAAAWLGAACPADAALIASADLPALTAALLETTVFVSPAETVIARSLDGGTNLLLQRPPLTLKLAFGEQSCAVHRGAALAAKRSVEVIEHPMLARDVDHPDDVAAILPLLGTSQTRSLLEQRHLARQRPPRGARFPSLEASHGPSIHEPRTG